MSTERAIERCVIIGAGMAGLMAARRLAEKGVACVVLEKSRGLGGRMATRRIEGGVLDHGAQFLTARDARFCRMAEEWEAKGVIREWCRGFPSATGSRLCDGHPRYRSVGGMTGLARHLADGIDVRLQARVVSLRAEGGRWNARTEEGELFEGNALILTPPVPQSLELLDASGVAMRESARKALSAIDYDPCIAAMAVLSEPSALPDPGAIQFDSGPVAFLSDNHKKGISPGATAITIQSGAEFAREHWESDDKIVWALMMAAVSEWVEPGSARVVQIKRWRYSAPLELFAEASLTARMDPPLIFAGDAFGGPRIEGAALSGLAAAGALLGMKAE